MSISQRALFPRRGNEVSQSWRPSSGRMARSARTAAPGSHLCPEGRALQAQPEAPRRRRAPGLKKCGHCRKHFTVRVGTIFEDSHIPLHKWLQADAPAGSQQEGHSRNQLHRMLEITYKTAWFMGTVSAKRCVTVSAPGRRWRYRRDRRDHLRPRGDPPSAAPAKAGASPLRAHNTLSWRSWSAAGVRSYHVDGSTVAEVIPIVPPMSPAKRT